MFLLFCCLYPFEERKLAVLEIWLICSSFRRKDTFINADDLLSMQSNAVVLPSRLLASIPMIEMLPLLY